MNGYDGTLFTRLEAEKFINSIPTKDLAWIKFLVVHNTGSPNMAQEDATRGGEAQRMRNAKVGYAKWGGRGPSFWVFNSGNIGLGTPLPQLSVHSPSWNRVAIGVEMVADFRLGVDNPYTLPGLTIVDTTAWLFATILRKLNLKADATTIRLHKEDPKTTHDCPGGLFSKVDFITRVQAYMGLSKLPAAPGVPGIAVKETVFQPKQFVYSDYLRSVVKKVEGLRLTAYNDAGTPAIGYGHNASSGILPIVKMGDTITIDQAEEILTRDLEDKLRYINAWVNVPLTQGQIDGLCMFIFQQGPGNFKRKLLDDVNAKKHWTVAKRLDNWVHANPGVVRRRKFEAEIYRGNRPQKW